MKGSQVSQFFGKSFFAPLVWININNVGIVLGAAEVEPLSDSQERAAGNQQHPLLLTPPTKERFTTSGESLAGDLF